MIEIGQLVLHEEEDLWKFSSYIYYFAVISPWRWILPSFEVHVT
jgi:hypothetical protein